MKVRLGGLFSGVGGFELAWQRAGGEVAWMCEIDPRAQRVLKTRFPGIPVYEDVSQIDPDEVETVDVVTGGSPCQGFSVAGTRTGLNHPESRLFSDYVRIVDGLSRRGLSYAIWENVPGVLSALSDKGDPTFPHVLAAFLGLSEPVALNPACGWSLGLAEGVGRSVSWRILDSQHFGVPQRRKRIYVCAAIGQDATRRAFEALLSPSQGDCSRRFNYSANDRAYQCHGSNVGKMGTIRAGNGAVSGGVPFLVDQPSWPYERRSVRMLTPTECERLQAFPDGWTMPAGRPSSRYRALGNAVTVSVANWMLSRIIRLSQPNREAASM